jgi:hypothetical protein
MNDMSRDGDDDRAQESCVAIPHRASSVAHSAAAHVRRRLLGTQWLGSRLELFFDLQSSRSDFAECD